jgi:WD40 repeat protein
VSFWDVKKRQQQKSFPGVHSLYGRAVAFSADGRLAATGADDIVLWDVGKQEMLSRFGHSDYVWSLVFSSDGKWLISGHGDGAILIWDTTDHRLAANLNGHARAVTTVGLLPDGKRLVSAGADGVVIWDLEQARKEYVLPGGRAESVGVSLSPNGRFLLTTDGVDSATFWDLSNGSTVAASLRSDRPSGGKRSCFALWPDGHGVSPFCVFRKPGDSAAMAASDAGLSNVFNDTPVIAVSSDGRWFAGRESSGPLFLLDVERWRVIDKYDVADQGIIRICFSPDGKRLVTGSGEGEVWLWDARPLRPVELLTRHSSHVQSVVFSPDASRIASGGDDFTIRVCKVTWPPSISIVGTHSSAVLSLAFSADGKQLFSGEQDKSVRVYTRHKSVWGHRLN